MKAAIVRRLRLVGRRFRGQPGPYLWSIATLSIGLLCSLVAIVVWRGEHAVDRFHPQHERIARLYLTMNMQGETLPVLTPGALGPELAKRLPGVERQVRVRCDGQPLLLSIGDRQLREPGLCYADPAFPLVFGRELRYGEAGTALEAPFSLILSERLATRLFPGRNPVGEVVTLNEGETYVVRGVFAPIEGRSHLDPDLVVSFRTYETLYPDATSWKIGTAYTYVLLAPAYEWSSFRKDLAADVAGYSGGNPNITEVNVEPLADIYLASPLPAQYGEVRGHGGYVLIISVLAVMVLLVAVANYINITTSQIIGRFHSFGMYRMLGASRSSLVADFVAESVLLALFALVLAAGMLGVLHPLLESFLPAFADLIDPSDPVLWVLLGALTLATGVVAALYPAYYVARVRMLDALRSRDSAPGRAMTTRQVLVTFQFVASVALIAAALGVNEQLTFMRERDLGFDKGGVLVVRPSTAVKGQYAAFKEMLQHRTEVAHLTTAAMPGWTHVVKQSVLPEGYSDDDVQWVNTYFVDSDFTRTLSVLVEEGRDFDADRPSDAEEVLLINRAAARAFGWAEPVGKVITQKLGPNTRKKTVVGVVADFHYASKRQEIEPLIIQLTRGIGPFGNILVRAAPGVDEAALVQGIEAVWQQFDPGHPFEYAWLDQHVDAFYESENRLSSLLEWIALLTVVLAAAGSFALSAFMMNVHAHDIVIRKIFGATERDLYVRYGYRILRLVLVALFIAIPLVAWLLQRWLAGFAYVPSFDATPFIVPALAVLGVAVAASSYSLVKTVRRNPVHYLQRSQL